MCAASSTQLEEHLISSLVFQDVVSLWSLAGSWTQRSAWLCLPGIKVCAVTTRLHLANLSLVKHISDRLRVTSVYPCYIKEWCKDFLLEEFDQELARIQILHFSPCVSCSLWSIQFVCILSVGCVCICVPMTTWCLSCESVPNRGLCSFIEQHRKHKMGRNEGHFQKSLTKFRKGLNRQLQLTQIINQQRLSSNIHVLLPAFMADGCFIRLPLLCFIFTK